MIYNETRLSNKPTLFIPVLRKYNVHYTQTDVSFVYCVELETQTHYIVNIKHNDDNEYQIPEIYPTDFVYNTKCLNNIGIETKCLVWLQNNEIKKHKLPTLTNVDCFPIVKLYDYCRSIYDEFYTTFSVFQQWEALKHYDQLQKDLSIIEQNGLYTDAGFEYSEYNLYTLTGRPSNSYGGINYAALKKGDGSRAKYTSRFGKDGVLVEYDMRAFHVYLLSKLVKYDWPDPDIYGYFGTLYGDVTNAKEITFRQLYGGISEEYLHIDFFEKVNNLIELFYSEYLQNTLQSIVFQRNINIPNLNKLKVFNYMLQSFETEFNALLLSKINAYLYNQPTKLILYTYDSFLLDFNRNDDLNEISKIFEGIPVKRKYGKNYNMLTNA